MEIPLIFVFIVIYPTCLNGQTLDEVWIHTKDDNRNDAWSAEVFHFYKSLSKFDIYPSSKHELIFKLKLYGGDCDHSFILLSAAENLQSEDYYEIFITLVDCAIRRKHFTGNSALQTFDIGPTPCFQVREFNLSWNGQGRITAVTSDGVRIVDWTDPSPLPINGVGIKTGYGTEGIWAIKHDGLFNGYYCGKGDIYGTMITLKDTYGASVVQCAARCSHIMDCLGFNYNTNSSICQLIKSGEVVSETSALGWIFYTKCLDDKKMCLACTL